MTLTTTVSATTIIATIFTTTIIIFVTNPRLTSAST